VEASAVIAVEGALTTAVKVWASSLALAVAVLAEEETVGATLDLAISLVSVVSGADAAFVDKFTTSGTETAKSLNGVGLVPGLFPAVGLALVINRSGGIILLLPEDAAADDGLL